MTAATAFPIVTGAGRARERRLQRLRRLGNRLLPPGWPLVGLLAAFPLWWLLGLGQFIFWIMAVPMVLDLLRRPSIKVPPGFGLWGLFLVWTAVSVAFIGMRPTDTVAGSAGLLGYLMREVNYLVVTVALLYVGNLSQRELSNRRIVKLLGWLCIVTVGGGLLGTFVPGFSITSPLEMVLPDGLASDGYMQTLIRPESAQIMDVLGYEAPRPKAPWEYTNSWGNNLSLLVIWLFIGWWTMGGRIQRCICAVSLALAVIPVIYSLNRGLWVGLAIIAAYVAWRFLRGGKVLTLVVLAFLTLLVGVGVMASPLFDVVEGRLANPHSDDGRTAASLAAVHAADESVFLGWGSTREAQGSGRSIAIGKSADCPQCGNNVIGNNGQLWLLLISNGYVGALLYYLFFMQALIRYRNDQSIIGIGAKLTLLLPFLYMFLYSSLTAPLFITMIGLALLWRNDMHERLEARLRAAARRATVLRRGATAV